MGKGKRAAQRTRRGNKGVIGMYDYERLISYGEDKACFIPKCPICNRHVKADEEVLINGIGEVKNPNATCKKCGRVNMPFEGYCE